MGRSPCSASLMLQQVPGATRGLPCPRDFLDTRTQCACVWTIYRVHDCLLALQRTAHGHPSCLSGQPHKSALRSAHGHPSCLSGQPHKSAKQTFSTWPSQLPQWATTQKRKANVQHMAIPAASVGNHTKALAPPASLLTARSSHSYATRHEPQLQEAA